MLSCGLWQVSYIPSPREVTGNLTGPAPVPSVKSQLLTLFCLTAIIGLSDLSHRCLTTILGGTWLPVINILTL